MAQLSESVAQKTRFGADDEWHVDVPQSITEKPFATPGRQIA
jgi:hypothetical protein